MLQTSEPVQWQTHVLLSDPAGGLNLRLFPAFLDDEEVEALLRRVDAVEDEEEVWGGLHDAAATESYRARFLRPLEYAFDPVVRRIEDKVAAVTGLPLSAKEDPIKVTIYRPAAADSPCTGASPLVNLHHDRNHARPWRHTTCIMYLNTVEAADGGMTFFPWVGGVPEADSASPSAFIQEMLVKAHLAGHRIIPQFADGTCASGMAQAACTAALAGAEVACAAAQADLVRSRAPFCRTPDGGGVLIAARRGAAVCFDARADSSWHGACLVSNGAVKICAQKFKHELPDASPQSL